MALTTLSASPSQAVEVMSASLASRLGLEQAWQRQLPVPAGANSIVDQQIHVHTSKPIEYVEVVATMKRVNEETGEEESYEKVLRRIAIDQVDRLGKPIGRKEAERVAQNEIYRLTHRGIDAKITSRKVPRIDLYTISDDGTIECRNAENGSPIWMKRIGDRRLGYSKIGIDDDFMTVINGGNMIKLNVNDGVEIDSLRTMTPPLFGAIHAGGYSIIPTITRGIEAYPLDNDLREPFNETVAGLALAPPRKSPDSTVLAWGTDAGFVYFMESEGTPAITFRLNTDGIVSGRIAAASDDHFYFSSESGQVYGVKATRTGEVLWSRPYGEPFYNAPMVIGDQLLLRSTYGNLFSLNTDNGMMTWTYTVPNIDEIIGAFDGKIYVKLLTGGLSVIDLESGETINKTNDIIPNKLLINPMTNRLYLIGKTGSVQCLRPQGEVLPTFNEAKAISGAPRSTGAMANEKDAAAAESGMAAKAPTPKDPFGATPDPAAGADPFGAAGADPFGGGNDAMADPFGGGEGGADPFANPFGN